LIIFNFVFYHGSVKHSSEDRSTNIAVRSVLELIIQDNQYTYIETLKVLSGERI